MAARFSPRPDVALRVDANGSWCLSRAQRELRELDRDVGLELAEQPCESLEELSGLRTEVACPFTGQHAKVPGHALADHQRAGTARLAAHFEQVRQQHWA